MLSSPISLESIQIASPCRAEWDAMQGNDCMRFCPSCGKNVYNLSAMTREEAMRLMEKKENRVCVRLHRRSDGTVLTSDCPVGGATRKRQRRGIELLAGSLGFVATLFGLRGEIAARLTKALPSHLDRVEVATRIRKPERAEIRPEVAEFNAPVANELGVNAPVPAASVGSGETTMGVPTFNSDPTPTPSPSRTHTQHHGNASGTTHGDGAPRI